MRERGAVDCRGNARGSPRLALDDHEVLGTQHVHHKLGEHPLQVQVLGEHVDALGELAQAHLGDVSRDRGLCARETLCLELLHKRTLGANGLVANDLPDGFLPVVSLLSHVTPLN